MADRILPGTCCFCASASSPVIVARCGEVASRRGEMTRGRCASWLNRTGLDPAWQAGRHGGPRRAVGIRGEAKVVPRGLRLAQRRQSRGIAAAMTSEPDRRTFASSRDGWQFHVLRPDRVRLDPAVERPGAVLQGYVATLAQSGLLSQLILQQLRRRASSSTAAQASAC